jgi:multidrug efflux pump subunit AcrB
MLCILAVFIPAFFMGGMAKALFVPLTLAVGFSIIWAFFLSMTLVPILATWLLKQEKKQARDRVTVLDRMKRAHGKILTHIYNQHRLFLAAYALIASLVVGYLGTHIGREIFPRVESHALQLRIRAQPGTYIDKTEQILLQVIDLIKQTAGPENVDTTLAYVGTQPTQYAINTIFLWTSGPQEAVLQVAFKKDSGISTAVLKEKLRAVFQRELPGVEVSFEASGMVDKVMSAGAPTQIEIDVNGQNLDQDRQVASQIKAALAAQAAARDVQFGQPFDYPTLNVDVDREKAGFRGAHVTDIGKALVPVTSSSRFTLPNYWEDPKDGVNYQVQVEVPSKDISSIDDLRRVPIQVNEGSIPLKDLADVQPGTEVAEYDRYNLARMATVTGNLFGLDMGHAMGVIDRMLAPIQAAMPKDIQVKVRGQMATLRQMTDGLIAGLVFAVVVMLLLLSGTFESVPIALIVISNVPAVLTGALTVLYLSGSTLNIESFMGTIMAVGVSVSNSILLVTFADLTRRSGKHSWEAAVYGAQSRLRPVLMTAIAMVVGMIPMALGLSDSGQQTAPLARAVIGGLLGSTVTTLLIMPVIYAVVHKNKPTYTASLDPLDPQSAYFEERKNEK